MSVDGNLFDVQNVSVVFHIGGILGGVKLVAVNDVSFTLSREKAEIFTIAGESGSGKTTLSRLLLGDLHPTSGKVFFEGRDLSTIRNRAELKAFIKKVQPVFQNPFETFNPLRRVEAYLYDTAINFGVAQNVKEAAMVVDHALQQVGLSLAEVSKRYPHELSGGQIQRISIARALIPKPRVILADEPVSMVDASLRMEIVNLFRTLRDEEKVSVIYITHDLATAYYISDRIAIMLRGNIVEAGPVEDVLERPMHPYSQLLKESVPEPEPEVKDAWVRHISLGVTEVKEYGQIGCKFAGRCPHVMAICRQADPPNAFIGARAVKCYLYTDQAQEPARPVEETTV